MTTPLAILSFILVLVGIIITHELGHFISAKASGVRVDEFGLGFPPRLLSFKRGETIYSLNAIPLGGFVKMAGEEDPKIPGSLASKRIPIRFLVISAGSLMNLLLPLLLFSIAFMIPHDTLVGEVKVVDVVPNSPAEKAGIEPGDTILSINEQQLNSSLDASRLIQLNLGKEITLLIEHEDATQENMTVTPRWKPPEGSRGAVGFLINTTERNIVKQSYPFWQAIPLGVKTSIENFILFKNGIISMIIGAVPVELAGPVGIAQVSVEVARAGISPLLEFAAFLSMNLAIINLFPLPALDGGRLAFISLEWIRRGKRISPKREALVHMIGFAMLIIFFAIITYRDIIRIVSGESLLP